MIKKLSDALVSQVSAYSELSDLNECIIQLVYNSIDAQASIIIVKFDPDIFYVEIMDNGKGIEPQNWKNLGQKQLFFQPDPRLYGQRGKFLQDLVSVSDRVEIVSGNCSKFFCQKSSWIAPSIQNEKFSGTALRAFNIFGGNQLRQKQGSFDIKNLVANLEILSLVNFKIKFYFENLKEKRIVFNSIESCSVIDQFKNFIKFYSSVYEHCWQRENFKISAIFVDYQKKENYLFFNNFYLKNEIYYELIKSILGQHRFNYCFLVTTNQLEYKICHHGNYKNFIRFNRTEFEWDFRKFIENFVRTFLVKMGLQKVEVAGTLTEHSSPNLQPEELKNSRASKQVKFLLSNKKNLNLNFKNFRSKKLRINKKLVKLNHVAFFTQFKAKYGLFNNWKNFHLKTKKDQSTQTDCVEIKEHWSRFWTEQGTEFYVNKLNGYSTYDLDLAKASPTCVDNMPKVLKINDHLKLSNYDQLVNDVQKRVVNKWFLKENVQHFEPISKFKIEKNIFENLKIMGQIDQKFIASFSRVQLEGASCVSIFLFDQHACHERVRLEDLLAKNITDNCIISEFIENYVELELRVISSKCLENFLNSIRKLGFEIRIDSGKFYLVKAPRFLVHKIENKESGFLSKVNRVIESELNKSYNQKQDADHLRWSRIPLQLMDLFNTEACRGAIKFGDKLTVDICRELIKKLSCCKLPFSCAHGRPTVVPIKQIFKQEITRKKPNLKNLSNLPNF